MKRFVFFFVLIFLASQWVFSQNRAQLLRLAKQHTQQALVLKDSALYDSAGMLFAKAGKIYEQNRLWREFLRSKTHQSSCLRQKHKPDRAAIVLENALAKALPHKPEKDTVLAEAHRQLGLAHYHNYAYPKALRNLYQAIALRQKTTGKNDALVAQIYNEIGQTYYFKSQLDSALDAFEQALEIRRNLYGEDHIEVANIYNNMAIIFDQQSDFAQAEKFYSKAFEIRKRKLPEIHPDMAASYGNLGQLYQTLSRYNKSLEYRKKAVEIYLALYGENHLFTARAYRELGMAYRYLSQYKTALENYQKARSIFERTIGHKNRFVAGTLQSLAAVYEDMGEYNRAMQYRQQELQLQKKLFGENDWKVGGAYSAIGNDYSSIGDYERAQQYKFKALKIYLANFGEKSRYTLLTYDQIASNYLQMEQYERALEYLKRAQAIREALYEKKHSGFASHYSKIGNVYLSTQRPEKALKMYHKALGIALASLSETNNTVAAVYDNIASAHVILNQLDSAVFYTKKSLAIQRKIYEGDHTNIAISLVNLAQIYKEKGNLKAACRSFEQSIAMLQREQGATNPILAKAYNQQAHIKLRQNKTRQALEIYHKALCANLPDFSDSTNIHTSPPEIKNVLAWRQALISLKMKAVILANHAKKIPGTNKKQGMNIALKHLRSADSLIVNTRHKILSTTDKFYIGKIAADIYATAIDLCLKMKHDKNAMENAFYFAEQSKTAVLMESLAAANARQFAGIEDSLLQKERKLKIDIAYCKKQLAEKPDSARQKTLSLRLFALNRSHDSLRTYFEENYPAYYQLRYARNPVSVKQIQHNLPPQTALVSYVTGDSSVSVLTLTRQSIRAEKKPQGENFQNKMEIFQQSLSTQGSRLYKDSYTKLGYEIYSGFFPSKLSKNIKNLIIIPDGMFSQIPFEAWLTQPVSPNTEYAQMPYLINDYTISYSYSAKLFHRLFGESREKQKQAKKNFLALAPVFDSPKTSLTRLRTRTRIAQNTDSEKANTRSLLSGEKYIAPLPQSEAEARAIFDRFENKGFNALALLYEEANEDFIQAGKLANYSFLHFATHGFVNHLNPEFSGLLLAQDSTSQHDGILHTAEIYNLRLNAELTVLSACETALGKIERGEGIIGLTRALLYAGSRNQVVSLWKVADHSTSRLMIDFYDNFLKKNENRQFASALRQAKLQMIRNKEYAQPFFWSPFVLIGK